MNIKLNKSLLIILLTLFPLILFSCGGGDDVPQSLPPTSLDNFPAHYSTNGVNWNDYVEDDGSDKYSATDTACDPASPSACLHGGEMRMFEFIGVPSCTGVTSSDALGAFDWVCDDSVGAPRIISTGLKDGKGLSDLLNLTASSWKENSLTVYRDSVAIETTNPAVWWANPVVENTTGGMLNAAGSIYVVPGSMFATIKYFASKVALVAAPGVVINGLADGADSYVISADNADFIWLEGITINATGDQDAVNWHTVRQSTIRNLTTEHANMGSGLHLSFSSNNTLSNVIANNNNYGVFLSHSSNNNMLSSVTVSNNNVGIYHSSSKNTFLDMTASNNNYGVIFTSSSDNTLSDITANDNGLYGFLLESSSNNNMLSSITVSNNDSYGIIIDSSSNNKLSGVTANNNDISGVSLGSTNNTLTDVTTTNNGFGVVVGGSNNILSGVTTSNNDKGVELMGIGNTLLNVVASNNSTGISLEGSNHSLSNVTVSNSFYGIDLAGSNHTFSGVTAFNSRYGIYLINSNNNMFTGVTASNNLEYGFYLDTSSANTLSNVTVNNNGNSGIYLIYASDNNTFAGLTATDNGQYGIYLSDSSDNYFTEILQVGNNPTDCYITNPWFPTFVLTNPGLDDDSDPSDQGNDIVHDGICVQEGTSDFGTALTSLTSSSSFVGKITSDESYNTSDINGSATITDFALPFDWTNFENCYRAWGVDGSLFPHTTNRGNLGCTDITYTNQTDCEANSFTWRVDARIWDWSLTSSDTVVKGVHLLPTGNDTLTNTWSDTSTSTLLRNAVEIQGDSTGNDNTLCESGEDCLYTPNMGSYQGHGNLIPAGSIGTGGTIENVTLWKYETNGY